MNEQLDKIARDVVDSSLQIHRALGPGLLESVYTVILERRLIDLGYDVEREKPIPVDYDGIRFELGFRADLVIEKCFLVEIKSVERIAPVHAKQLLTYLKVTKFRLGLLINFGESLLKDGTRRIAN